MSFNAKHLSYESNEPAFLRRLRNEHGDHDSSRHERPMARPRKQVQDGESDDQPTYVMEDSQDTLSKAEYEALATNSADTQTENNLTPSANIRQDAEEVVVKKDTVFGEETPTKQQVAGIGVSTKRRLAKVVGNEEEDEAAEKSDLGKKEKKIKAKKGKKMKLSFDEDATDTRII